MTESALLAMQLAALVVACGLLGLARVRRLRRKERRWKPRDLKPLVSELTAKGQGVPKIASRLDLSQDGVRSLLANAETPGSARRTGSFFRRKAPVPGPSAHHEPARTAQWS